MEVKITEEPVKSNISNEKQKTKIGLGIVERLGIRDENAGYKIIEIADSAGMIGALCAIVMAFLCWNQVGGIRGFVYGLLIAVAGIFAACVLASVLYGYGGLINNTIEQTKILKKMEENKALEALTTDRKNEHEQIDETTAATDLPLETDMTSLTPDIADIEQLFEEVLGVHETIRPDRTIEAVMVDRLRRQVHLKERSALVFICPICSRKQLANRDMCFYCDCAFIYDNEHAEHKLGRH